MNNINQEFSSSLIFLTNRLGRLLANEIRDRTDIEAHGILPHHMGILVDLWQKDGIRQQELAVSTIKDKATITRAVNYLETANILLRVADAQDKRIKRIYLTHKGKELKEVLLPHTRELELEITNSIDKNEYKTCIKVLQQIYQLLHN